MLNTLIIQNQKGLARLTELACPFCNGVVEWGYTYKCMNCWRKLKMKELKAINLVERIKPGELGIAEQVYLMLWESNFLKIIEWISYDWVIFSKANYRFIWENKIWKRLWRVKKWTRMERVNDHFYEYQCIRNWVGINWNDTLCMLKIFREKWEEKNPVRFKRWKWHSDKEDDIFMKNMKAMVSAFIRWYDNLYEKAMDFDATDEDIEKFNEMLGTWITDKEIQQLKSWELVALSSLVPAIEYLISRSIRPSVSLLKQTQKINLINDLPSTHPFYDLFHEKPL